MTLLSAPLDIDEIDEYLCQLILPRILSAFQFFPQIKLKLDDKKDILLAIVKALVVYASLGQTPATKALGLEIQHAAKRRVALWIAFSVVLPTIYRRIQMWYQQFPTVDSHQQIITASTGNQINHIGIQRKRHLTKMLIQLVERVIPPINLLLLLSWFSKKSKVHSLPLLLSGLSYTTIATLAPPQNIYINVQYAHRRWFYEEFMKTMRLLVPSWEDFIDMIPKWRRTAPLSSSCPVCHTAPIVVPYRSNACEHTYCYTCLWHLKTCRVCRQPITTRIRV